MPEENSDFNLAAAWTKTCQIDWLKQVLPSAGCGHEYGESKGSLNGRFKRQFLLYDCETWPLYRKN